ncbi:succinylglutamate desuccinylase/aspartoacylase family protein [Dactylosporangium sp. NPDC005572]|uniref:succinylglutamate desuccinylase/aspartoacylase domain-containing protein n=1 Tax=Dactylosporangium sp. NPDC005572 TaxID=3156889 RepID=UPI0033B02498
MSHRYPAVEVHRFAGAPGEVLVLAGVHGSERAGVEVARRLIGALRNGPPRRRAVAVVPTLFAANVAGAERAFRTRLTSADPADWPDDPTGRRTTLADGTPYRDPNRNMPPIGWCHRSSQLRDALGFAIEAENLVVLDLVAQLRPALIVSIHGIRRVEDVNIASRGRLNLPGVFVDPVTDLALELTRANHQELPPVAEIDRLALDAAARISERQHDLAGRGLVAGDNGDLRDDWVVGNWLQSTRPTARYARPNSVDEGVSLGEWGSRAVLHSSRYGLDRPGIPIVTVEVRGYYTSADCTSGAAMNAGLRSRKPVAWMHDQGHRRGLELQAHADAIADVFLDRDDVPF